MLAPVRRPISAGTVIGAKYRVERIIASGGQGTVVEATHLRLRHPVAIKFPHVDEIHRDDRWARLFREARAAFRLRGEHVARVIDVDVVGGSPFIVMEYLRGVDLQAWLAERGARPHDEAVGLVLQACDGVAEAHDLGIVHRDLKPSNLFLVDSGGGPPLLKVLDFGMAKSLGPCLPNGDDPDLTEPLLVLGTPRYMSPEQARDSRAVDPRTDIWSLGVILQELLTGRPVFRARNRADILAQVLLKNPTPVTLLRPETPPELERVLLRCLQKTPEHRFSSIRELAAALAPFAARWAAPAVARLASGGHVPPARPSSWESDEDPSEGPTTNEVATPPPRVFARRPPVVNDAVALDGAGSAVTRVLPEQQRQPIARRRQPARTAAVLGAVVVAGAALVFSWRLQGRPRDVARTGSSPLAAARPLPGSVAAAAITPVPTAPTIEPMAASLAAPAAPSYASTAPAVTKARRTGSARPAPPFATQVRKAAHRPSLARRRLASSAPAPKLASLDRSPPVLTATDKSPPASASEVILDDPLDGRK